MGESRRRKEIFGTNYGIANIDQQIKAAWANINKAVDIAKSQGHECLLIQCCNNDKGFCYDAISRMRQDLDGWRCELSIPVLIQMLPQGFKSSETKLFDGFVTVWCNRPNYKLWKVLFETKV